ncbi:MAG TPA: hypothetical protein PKG95_10825, partial [Anaerolineaceae bacterium]|nr:hypothetical protein [Anaerolineaceae bacterium]
RFSKSYLPFIIQEVGNREVVFSILYYWDEFEDWSSAKNRRAPASIQRRGVARPAAPTAIPGSCSPRPHPADG